MKLGYSPWGNGTSIDPFDSLFSEKQDVRQKGLNGIDALVLWGGTDIWSGFYKEKPHPTNQAGREPSNRDTFEWSALKYCFSKGIPIIGVCRGAQMLCAAAGGKLIQDCSGHNKGSHKMTTFEGDVIPTNSYHHQMMYPYVDNVQFEPLAWTDRNPDRSYYGNSYSDLLHPDEELEVVYFPKIKGLAIQGHPEWMGKDSLFNKFNLAMVKEYLL